MSERRRVEAVAAILKTKFPNLPVSAVVKLAYAILEAVDAVDD